MCSGSVAEWSIAVISRMTNLNRFVGPNPT